MKARELLLFAVFSAGLAALSLLALAIAWIAIANKKIQITNDRSQQAEMLSEQTAAILEGYKKSPFANTTLDAISINSGPFLRPTVHALYVHPCDWVYLIRHATVKEDMVASVSRSIQWAPGNKFPLAAGSEQFSVNKNPNEMRPAFQIPSNPTVPHYRYIQYEVFLQDVSRPSPAEPLQTITFYIIDSNQPIPKPGDRIPLGPGPHDPSGPSCPASLNAPSLQGP